METIFLDYTNNKYDYNIGEYRLAKISNVSSVTCEEEGKFGWGKGYGYLIKYNDKENNNNNENIYYILDTHNQNAFGHWVYEDFCHIDSYILIKKMNPTCKLVLYEKKNYKELFLKSRGINIDDIIYKNDVNFEYNTLDNKNNIIEINNNIQNTIYFHFTTSTHDIKYPIIFENNINNYMKIYENNESNKIIPIVYLPRGKIENFKPHDRIIDVENILIEYVKYKGGMIFNVDENKELINQINVVRISKIVILEYGSSFHVNGLFSKNAIIILLRDNINNEIRFPAVKYIYDKIKSNNIEIYDINSHIMQRDDGMQCVYHDINTIIKTIESIL